MLNAKRLTQNAGSVKRLAFSVKPKKYTIP